MIVVTAPNGQIGQHVCRDLLAADAPVRVLVRDPAKRTGYTDRVRVTMQPSFG